jgi:predicted O-methyltransferase YrrM
VTQLSGFLREIALSTTGFMPEDEGDALFAAALSAGKACPGLPFVEIGSYCGRSTVWFGEAARLCDTMLHAVDHHGGSEENQPGWEWHDQSLVDAVTGRLNTLPHFEHTMQRANLNSAVKAVVGDSPVIASTWNEQIGMLFIDGGHGREVARNDYVAWTPHVAVGGTLAIHDVFIDPALGGQAPYEEIYLAAINSENFVETSCTGSLRILHRVK